jgi:hypothetical protein
VPALLQISIEAAFPGVLPRPPQNAAALIGRILFAD